MEDLPAMPAIDQNSGPAPALLGRRLHYRQKLSGLAYVNLDHVNGGIVRDLGESGLAMQSVTPLRVNQQVQLRLLLLRPRLHVEAAARVAWSDATGHAGVEFLNPERSRRPIKHWILTQLLLRAQQAASTGSIFAAGNPTPDNPTPDNSAPASPELAYSTAAWPAPREEPQRVETFPSSSELENQKREKRPGTAAAPVRLYGFSVPTSSYARLVDSLLLLAAVLLFSVLAMAWTLSFPSWPVALSLGIVVSCIFAALYWFLFVAWVGATPGEHLAHLAAGDSAKREEKNDRLRFR